MSVFFKSIPIWYRQNRRFLPWRETPSPYNIWLSEIILQQTRVDQGLPYYQKFIETFPSIHHLAKANQDQVLKLWEGLGYYSRARNLHTCAQQVVSEYKGEFPSTKKELLKLKGIGPYTASAISSIAFGKANAVVDGNVYRVLSRFFNISTPINSSKGIKEFQEIADTLIDTQNPGDYNQGLMELGATICTPTNPKCAECPLSDGCEANFKSNWKEFPVKEKKLKVKKRNIHFVVLKEKDSVYIQQRQEKDIWQGLFEFPSSDNEPLELLKHQGIKKVNEVTLKKHILSHQHIYSTFHEYLGDGSFLENGTKIKITALDTYSFPKLIHKYFSASNFLFKDEKD